jgi:saccharopine dehydrogenase-like NADP-dependent oxidoreductase
MQVMSAMMQAGLLSSRIVSIGGETYPSREVVRRLLQESPVSRENPVWAYGLVVEVSGMRDSQSVRCTYRSQHPPASEWGGEAAYYKNVGIPLSIGAQLIANGEALVLGVQPPELALPVAPFFQALALRGITVEETVVQESVLA